MDLLDNELIEKIKMKEINDTIGNDCHLPVTLHG